MPPNRNLRGGKGYKKGKKSGEEREVVFNGRTAGQDYGRVIRILGNRRVILYCNDTMERICRIRGAMCRGPKKQIISIGDIVLFSLRLFDDGSSSDDVASVGIETKTGGDAGDIILKYEHSQWRQLRKEAGVNPNLFVDATTSGSKQAVVDIFASESGDEGQEDTINHVNEGPSFDDDADVDIDRI